MPTKRTGRRRPSKNYRRNFVAIPFFTDLALSTLVDNVLIDAAILTFGEDCFVISADILVSVQGLTAGEGPLVVGLAHGDLTTTEVQEAIDAEVTDPDDIIAKERARRPVRRIGILSGVTSEQFLAQGTAQRITIRISVGDGHTLNVWCVNRSGANLAGGAIVTFAGTLWARWQR